MKPEAICYESGCIYQSNAVRLDSTRIAIDALYAEEES